MEFVVEPTRMVAYVEDKLYVAYVLKINSINHVEVDIHARVGDNVICFKFTFTSYNPCYVKDMIKSICANFIVEYRAKHDRMTAKQFGGSEFDNCRYNYAIYYNVYGQPRAQYETDRDSDDSREFLRTFA